MKKNSLTIARLPYVTFDQLCEIGEWGSEWNYNRRLDAEDIKNRTKPGSPFFVLLHFEHNYRFMQPCEPHMRLLIGLGDGEVLADVPMDYFKSLPGAYVIRCNKSTVLVVVLDNAGNTVEVTHDGPPERITQAIDLFVRETGNKYLGKLILDQCLAAG